ncbi:hypothetical protein ACFQ9X_29295 [Catenulispora yoronensis]
MTVPQAKVTMLGTKGSGKTTYLLGMYAVLSAGVQGHTLVTTDLDDDEDMADAWYELCDNGRVPRRPPRSRSSTRSSSARTARPSSPSTGRTTGAGRWTGTSRRPPMPGACRPG